MLVIHGPKLNFDFSYNLLIFQLQLSDYLSCQDKKCDGFISLAISIAYNEMLEVSIVSSVSSVSSFSIVCSFLSVSSISSVLTVCPPPLFKIVDRRKQIENSNGQYIVYLVNCQVRNLNLDLSDYSQRLERDFFKVFLDLKTCTRLLRNIQNHVRSCKKPVRKQQPFAPVVRLAIFLFERRKVLRIALNGENFDQKMFQIFLSPTHLNKNCNISILQLQSNTLAEHYNIY